MAFGCIMEFGNIGTGFSLSVDSIGGWEWCGDPEAIASSKSK